jgi:transcriptional regulator
MMTELRSERLHGTLDMLVLEVLARGPMHGYAIAQQLRQIGGEILQIEQGSLYPALYRLEERGWLKSKWGMSEKNRRARVYQLTRRGRKQLAGQVAGWREFVRAIDKVVGAGEGSG